MVPNGSLEPPGLSKLVLQPPQSSKWFPGASRAVQMVPWSLPGCPNGLLWSLPGCPNGCLEPPGLSKWLQAARMAPNPILDVLTAGCGFTSCLGNLFCRSSRLQAHLGIEPSRSGPRHNERKFFVATDRTGGPSPTRKP